MINAQLGRYLCVFSSKVSRLIFPPGQIAWWQYEREKLAGAKGP